MLHALSVHPGLLVHMAGAMFVAGFLLRDQLALRVVLLGGNILYLAYYLTVAATPLWEPAAWSSAMFLANGSMIALILRDRALRPRTEREARLHSAFGHPPNGSFRRLLRLARIGTAAEPHEVIAAGARPSHLFYVLSGTAIVTPRNGPAIAGGPGFYGEISVLLDREANATVTLLPGTEYLVWNRADLARALDRRPDLRSAVEHILTRDMARKIGGASPTDAAPTNVAPA